VPESFLKLSHKEQAEVILGASGVLGRAPVVLEKDLWVCRVLLHLFEMPERLMMAFKGGTSLSKVSDAIARFSEDVDVTLDYRGFESGIDPFSATVSKTQLRKLSDALKVFVSEHSHDVVAPYFERLLAEQFDRASCRVEVSDDGEQLRIHYPSVLDTSGGYVGNSVLVEFGGRNITEPSQVYELRPYVADVVTELTFPVARVDVLSPMRTFWEKATLIHVECHRGEFRSNVERLSRHWYDLAMLAEHSVGLQALEDRKLLADVVKHKKVFFNASYANYNACLSGQFRLLPEEAVLSALQLDFERMLRAGMFFGEQPSFANIVTRLRELEAKINSSN